MDTVNSLKAREEAHLESLEQELQTIEIEESKLAEKLNFVQEMRQDEERRVSSLLHLVKNRTAETENLRFVLLSFPFHYSSFNWYFICIPSDTYCSFYSIIKLKNLCWVN